MIPESIFCDLGLIPVVSSQQVLLRLSESLYFLKLFRKFGRIRRYRIVDENKSLPEDNGFVVRKQSTVLQREVVHLNAIGRLYLHLASISGIAPGRYQVSVHIIFGKDFAVEEWPCTTQYRTGIHRPDISTYVKVFHKSPNEFGSSEGVYYDEMNDQTLVEGLIEPEYCEYCERLHENGVVSRNGNFGHLIKLRPFVISEETDLEVDWEDHRNSWWKRGMSWDYVQLEEM